MNQKKKEALVGKGLISINCPFDSLRLANSKKTKTNSKEQAYIITTSRSSKLEYDCRGMRIEEFKETVENAISDLMLNHVPYVCIIHGHGTGVLKNWLRDYIRKNPDVKREEDKTGNDGETRIILS